MPKRCQKRLYDHITIVLCKKPPQKTPIIRKMRAFWKWPKLAKTQISLWRMVSFAQKLKMPKSCQKRLYDHIRVVVCKKISKTHQIFEKRDYFGNGQNWPRHKGYSLCKMVSLAQKLKMPKRCQNRLYDHVTVVVCKKTALKKHLIFEKWEHFENGQNWPRRRGFSLCKWSVWFKN